jgi:hypothetical protein
MVSITFRVALEGFGPVFVDFSAFLTAVVAIALSAAFPMAFCEMSLWSSFFKSSSVVLTVCFLLAISSPELQFGIVTFCVLHGCCRSSPQHWHETACGSVLLTSVSFNCRRGSLRAARNTGPNDLPATTSVPDKRELSGTFAHRLKWMRRVRLRVVAYWTALQCCLLAALAILTVWACWLSPVAWLIITRNLPSYALLFRLNVFLLLMLVWVATTTSGIRAIRAIHRKSATRSRKWTDEVKQDRQAAIAELIRCVRSCGVSLPRGRLEVCLAFPSGVGWQRTGPFGARGSRLLLSLQGIAVLSRDELCALAVQRAFQVFEPPSPLHPWLERSYHRVRRWRSALPVDSGFPSLVHKLVEWLAAILKPIPPQLGAWSQTRAKEIVSAETLLAANEKLALASASSPVYLNLYVQALGSGDQPPFAQGLHQLLTKTSSVVSDDPFYAQLRDLWVHEQRFARALKGPGGSQNLRMASWDDLQAQLSPQHWKDQAAELRPHLSGQRVSDIPELIRDWRSLTRRFVGRRTSNVTPDVLRKSMIERLGAAFAVVLLEAGWEPISDFGRESTFRRAGQELKPFQLLRDVGAGRVTAEEFAVYCRAVGQLELW